MFFKYCHHPGFDDEKLSHLFMSSSGKKNPTLYQFTSVRFY